MPVAIKSKKLLLPAKKPLILHRPSRLQIVGTRRKEIDARKKLFTLADDNFSFDERVHRVVTQIIEEGLSIEDKGTREQWLDAVQSFARTGDVTMLLTACEWKRTVVPMDEFIYSDVFLGMDAASIYPAVQEALHELDSGKYDQAVLKGAIGTGKTTISNVMIGRTIHKISCMRHPQETFGIQPKSSLVITIQSVRLSTAKRAVFEEFGNYIKDSSYFREIYPYDRRVLSEMKFPQQNLRVLPVTSSSTGAISMNVIAGLLDEVNFMQKIENSKSSYADNDGSFDQAKNLYNTLARRRRSRFTKKGQLPGILFLVSSSRYPDDFTEEKAKEAASQGGEDEKIFVYNQSQWTAKARDTFMDEEFRVQVGNELVQSRVLAEGEETDAGCRVINVPMDFRSEFLKDVNGALRDYAGITILASNPFIGRRDSINDCMILGKANGYVNPFNLEEVDLSLGRFPKPHRSRLRRDVPMWRHCHVDLGLTKDAAGITVGHIAGTRVIERRSKASDEVELEVLPVIGIDVCLRVVPPSGGEIEFAQIRKFIMKLKDEHGLDIRYVTFDGFQSVDSRQILRAAGFQTDYWSVEKIDTYRSFRDALYEKRVLLPQHHILAEELASLEHITKNNVEKVDHPPQGCFTGETRVALADGTNPTFKELAKRYKKNEIFYVYSMTENGVSIAAARNPRITKRAKKLVEVTLDNNQVIRCTPEHLFMTLDGEWVQAQNLTPDISIMPLYRSRVHKGGWAGYERVWCPIRGARLFTHQLAAGLPGGDTHVHHRDEVKHNNDPRNLEVKTHAEHTSGHSTKNWEHRRKQLLAGHTAYYQDQSKRAEQASRIKALWDRGEFGPRRAKCAIEGCSDLSNARGLCGKHYRHFKTRNALPERTSNKRNHRVLLVEFVTANEDVYDLTVPGLENFALSSGVFVHNSKDVADSVCAVVSFLMKRRAAWAGLEVASTTGLHLIGDVRRAKAASRSEEEKKAAENADTRAVLRRNIKRKAVSRKPRAQAA